MAWGANPQLMISVKWSSAVVLTPANNWRSCGPHLATCTRTLQGNTLTCVCLPIMIWAAQKGVFLSFTVCIFPWAVKRTPTFSNGEVVKGGIKNEGSPVLMVMCPPFSLTLVFFHHVWLTRFYVMFLPGARPETGNVNQKKAALDLQGGFESFPLSLKPKS